MILDPFIIRLDRSLDRLYVKIRMEKLAREKTAYAKKRVKMIHGGYKGSGKEWKEKVLRYWERFGIRPQKYWYAIYCNGMDHYDPRYIPDWLWYRRIIPYFNDITMRRAYTDKCIYNRLFPDVTKPDTVVKNIAGYYFNGDKDEMISREEAERICMQEEHLIIKPAVNSGRGKRIQFFDRDEGNKSIGEIFSDLRMNFVVQRIVKQHPDLAKINASSLNTIRVMSLRFKGETHILSAQLRMGGINARMDNVSAGGCACNIKPDGWLSEFSVNRKSKWTDKHPCGIYFRDIRVPNFSGITEAVKKLHAELPYFGIIGWDFAVDEKENPVFIEFNVMPEQNQIGSRHPAFGDLTDKVLEEVFIAKDKLN